jgi:hypothetical protein
MHRSISTGIAEKMESQAVESRVFCLTKKARSRYILSGIFLLFGSAIGFLFTFSGAYSIVFTVIVFLFSLTGATSSLFYFLSIKKTLLKTSELSIEFIYPTGHKVIDWASITRADVNSSWFRLCYVGAQKSDLVDLISDFFYRKNEIPVHLFLDNWQNEECWDEEPLLGIISNKLHWDTQL